MIKCLRARLGNVHRKQNCFRGVLLFKTHFAEFCVKSVCKTEPWNWAVSPYLGSGKPSTLHSSVTLAPVFTFNFSVMKVILGLTEIRK